MKSMTSLFFRPYVMNPIYLLAIVMLGMVACQKEEPAEMSNLSSNDVEVGDRAAVNCGCEVRVNSVTDNSGMDKPIQLWELLFIKPTNGNAISFVGSPASSQCPAGPSNMQLGVWYTLPGTVCSKLCSTIRFSAVSGSCNESWRATANMSLRSTGNILNFNIVANSNNTGVSLPGTRSYQILQSLYTPGCAPFLCN